MSENRVKNIAIVGGGTSGWMTAAALSKLLPADVNVTLVESADIPNIGVGEATIPQIQLFNQLIGIDEDDFIRATKATFKHGIEFINWRKLEHSYFHPFGTLGLNFDGVDFHHFFLRAQNENSAEDIQKYAFNSVAAKAGKMMRSVNVPNSPLSNIAYAYHFDSGLYVEYLKSLSIRNGVNHVLAKVNNVVTQASNGFIHALELDTGATLTADLFIDCSGFRGVLIEQTLNTGYQSWQHLLPCDRAIVAQSQLVGETAPHTQSIAQSAGWQWKIPLQHRMGNGYVYSSKFISDDEAKKTFVANVEGALLTEPRVIHFNAGIRNKFWNKNCVAIGLSSGFIEPLESTAIHLIQSSIARLMTMFPTLDMPKSLINKYNQQATTEMLRIRDFIILHYKVTERSDSQFWNYVRTMDIPDTLQEKIDLFSEQARIFREQDELFNQTSWLSVMLGQGIVPKQYHPLADAMPLNDLIARLTNVESVIQQSVESMPKQKQFLDTILMPNETKG